MEILPKEEVESTEKGVREKLVELLVEEGYEHSPAEEESKNESCDFFIKDKELIEITITGDIPEDVLKRMIGEE